MTKTSALHSPLAFTSTLTFLLLYAITSAHASNIGSTKIYFNTGQKSQTSCIEERDLGGYFSFYKYGTKVTAEPTKGFSYRIGIEDYHKDFDTKRDHLDNRTNLYSAYFSMPVHKTDTIDVLLNTNYKLRTKRYKNSPSDEYDNNNVSAGINITKDKNYTLKLSGGIRNYEYVKNHDSNQLKSFFKIGSKARLLDQRLSLSGYYRRDLVDQADNKKDYSEDCVSIRTAYDIGKPIIDKIGAHFGYGRSDTRDDDEDREDNLRYEYQLWDVTLYSKPFKNIEGNIRYGQKHRKYFMSIDGYDNWYIDKNTKIRLIENGSFSVDMLLGGLHKETKFFANEALSYNKNSLDTGFNILKRSDFSIKPSFKYTRYKYPPLSTGNEKNYKLSVDCKKYIGSTDKAIEAGYWYKWKNYENKSNSARWNLSLSFMMKF